MTLRTGRAAENSRVVSNLRQRSRKLRNRTAVPTREPAAELAGGPQTFGVRPNRGNSGRTAKRAEPHTAGRSIRFGSIVDVCAARLVVRPPCCLVGRPQTYGPQHRDRRRRRTLREVSGGVSGFSEEGADSPRGERTPRGEIVGQNGGRRNIAGTRTPGAFRLGGRRPTGAHAERLGVPCGGAGRATRRTTADGTEFFPPGRPQARPGCLSPHLRGAGTFDTRRGFYKRPLTRFSNLSDLKIRH